MPTVLFEGFSRHRIHTEGATIACVEGGAGPPVLLLHGFPQSLAMWARVAPLLSSRFRVVCADLRGYGDSSTLDAAQGGGTSSFREMALDQVAVMRALGFERFHVVGHDRGGRVGHRMALDHPAVVRSLSVLDIVPTHALLTATDRHLAAAYWHWWFLSRPQPLPERLIAADPDAFFESFLVGLGGTGLDEYDPDMLAEYRRCWRRPETIRGCCADYRAAVSVDYRHDVIDLEAKVTCPTLALWGADAVMSKHFDIAAAWSRRCTRLEAASIPGGHYFVDHQPVATAQALERFLVAANATTSAR